MTTLYVCSSHLRQYNCEETNLADVIFIVKHESGDVWRNDGRVEDEY